MPDETRKILTPTDRALTLATKCAEHIKRHPNAGSWWNDPVCWHFIKEVYEPEMIAIRQAAEKEMADAQ